MCVYVSAPALCFQQTKCPHSVLKEGEKSSEVKLLFISFITFSTFSITFIE